jgi:hypothetical protein
VPELLLDEVQRLALDEPVGRGGVAQVVKAHRVAQSRVLERLFVPLLADHVARQRLGALGGQGAGDEREQLLADAVTLGDLALGQPVGDQVGGDGLAARARDRVMAIACDGAGWWRTNTRESPCIGNCSKSRAMWSSNTLMTQRLTATWR